MAKGKRKDGKKKSEVYELKVSFDGSLQDMIKISVKPKHLNPGSPDNYQDRDKSNK